MEIIESIEKWALGLNAILQSIIGCAIYALLIWLGRLFIKLTSNLNKDLRKARQNIEIIKILIHKRYVNSNGMYYFTQGYLLVIFKALRYIVSAFIIYFIGHGLSIFLGSNLLEYFGIYFCIQQLISGLSWLNPKWGSKDLAKYDKKTVQEITKQFTSSDPFSGDK